MAEGEAERIKAEPYRLHEKNWLNPEHAEGEAQGFYSISPYSEVLRGKLLHHFRLLEQISGRTGSSAVIDDPVAPTEEFGTVNRHRLLLRDRPYANIVASPYSSDKRRVYSLTHADHFVRQRRKVESKLSVWPPLGIFAHWLVNLPLFQNCVTVLIIVNAITLAATSQLRADPSDAGNTAITYFEYFDSFTLAIFTLEIALKFADDFNGFWDSSWNVFDLLITAVSYLPFIIQWASPASTAAAADSNDSGGGDGSTSSNSGTIAPVTSGTGIRTARFESISKYASAEVVNAKQ